MQTVAAMTALTRLTWRPYDEPRGGARMPRCEELASLRSTSLRDLCITIQQVP